MTIGIRAAVNASFVQLLPQRAEIGNRAFRAAVLNAAIAEHGISVASAATHYNHAFKQVKAANPELVEGLGRADDKKGGRKPKVKSDTVAVVEAAAAVALFNVVKAKDGTVVLAGVDQDTAEALVAKAASAKKAKLVITNVVTEVVEPEAVAA